MVDREFLSNCSPDPPETLVVEVRKRLEAQADAIEAERVGLEAELVARHREVSETQASLVQRFQVECRFFLIHFFFQFCQVECRC